MDIHLDLTKEEELFIKEMTQDTDVSVSELVKDLLLSELVQMAEMEEIIIGGLEDAKSPEELKTLLKEQMHKFNPNVSEEDIEQLAEDFFNSEFPFDDEDEDDNDLPDNVIPFDK